MEQPRPSTLSRWSALSYASFGSVLSIGSLFSAGSVLSIGSAGSILSIGSAGSLLTLGAAGAARAASASDDPARGRAIGRGYAVAAMLGAARGWLAEQRR